MHHPHDGLCSVISESSFCEAHAKAHYTDTWQIINTVRKESATIASDDKPAHS